MAFLYVDFIHKNSQTKHTHVRILGGEGGGGLLTKAMKKYIICKYVSIDSRRYNVETLL